MVPNLVRALYDGVRLVGQRPVRDEELDATRGLDVELRAAVLLGVRRHGSANAGGARGHRGAGTIKKKKTNDTRFLVLFARESGQKWLRRSRPMAYYARWICPLFTYISCTFGHFPCEFC